jgi:N-acetylgalactosamine-N,N'-diacetylbacillosaminyl-diphospho-undecaprenol 4-alpha-N-acetylgalactosaminyltransferase
MSGRPRRLLMAINSLEGGGAERVASLLLSAFAGEIGEEAGFTPELALLDDEPRRYTTPPDVPVSVLDARHSLARSVLGLRRFVRRDPPDAVLSFLSRANFAAIAATRGGPPCLISERVNTSAHLGSGLRGLVSRTLVRATYPLADRVIAVSQGVADDLSGNFGVAASRLAVIPNPYDLETLRRAAAEPPPPDLPRPYIVAVGRLNPMKNFPMLLRAYARSGVDHALVVLGEGEQAAALKALASELGLADRVIFKGFLANPHSVVAHAAAYVSASRAEGFPNAAAEALAVGAPVAMTDCPSGPAELLEGRAPAGGGATRARHGVLSPVNDERAFADAIRMILEPDVNAAFRAAGPQRMEAFELGVVTRRYAALVREAMAAR